MSALALCGWIALAFGAGTVYAVGAEGWFGRANLAAGALALAAAAVRAALRARGASASAFRGPLARGAAGVALALAGGVGLERAVTATGVRFDWSFERRFELSEATRRALAELGTVEAILFAEPLDPRARSTRLLLGELAATGRLRVRERALGEAAEEEDRFGVAGSNTVVLLAGGRSETVDRPTEGTIYEALYALRAREAGVAYVMRGAGEGDLSDAAPGGYSGLAAALETEGFRVRELVTATGAEVPDDADLVIALAPRRPLREEALAALERHLARGGRLVAFLEPGAQSGLEPLLARWGLASPDALVVDPASGALAGDPPGVNPLAYSYATTHPIARGLDASRMTFFRRARAFAPRPPEPEDRVQGVVFSSPRAWLAEPGAAARDGGPPPRPAGAEEDYHPLVAAGRYARDGRETRIVAFGDAELASNRYLRTLYNLDLVLNAALWAAEREPDIAIRPKAVVSGRLQLPLPVPDTFTMFQGLGLLLPEALLLAAALAWARARSA